jgi:hypothetical protein
MLRHLWLPRTHVLPCVAELALGMSQAWVFHVWGGLHAAWNTVRQITVAALGIHCAESPLLNAYHSLLTAPWFALC